MQVELDKIYVDDNLYPRSFVDFAITVHQYKEAAEAGAQFPDIEITPRGDRFLLIDGKHRLEAFKRLKRKTINATIIKNITDAELFKRAVEINVRHGRKLSVQEKVAAANRLLTEFDFGPEDVSSIVSMPISSFKRLIDERIDGTTRTGVAALLMTKKAPMVGTQLDSPQQQAGLAARDQRQIFQQALTIIKYGKLDTEDKELMAMVSELKELLGQI